MGSRRGFTGYAAQPGSGRRTFFCSVIPTSPLTDYDDGLYILNPGSLRGRGTYGLLDVTPTGVLLNVVENRR